MNITIDMEAVQAAVNETITKEVSQAAISYETKKGIANAFAWGPINDAVEKGVREADVDTLAKAIVSEVLRTTAQTARLVLEDAAVDVICRIRGVYTDGERNKVREEIKRINE